MISLLTTEDVLNFTMTTEYVYDFAVIEDDVVDDRLRKKFMI